MRTKAPPPIDLLARQNLSPILEAFFEFAQLKQLYRQGWLRRGLPPERCESVAEHSMGVAILAMWLSEAYFPGLDRLKVLSMALLHDFGEIYTGDLVPSDAVSVEEKQTRERESIVQVLTKLPKGDQYVQAWEEFEQGETPEARLVHQVDRLEMGLQAGIYGLQGAVDPQEFLQSAKNALTDQPLSQVLIELMEQVKGKTVSRDGQF